MNTTNRKIIQDQIDQAIPHPNGKTRKLYRIGNADFLLQVTGAGVKSWAYRYTIKGKTRVVGMGPVRRVSFDEAQKLARKIRVILDDGRDPLEERDRALSEKIVEIARQMTFRQCAEIFIADHRDGWKSAKHAAQWTTTLERYAYKLIGSKPIAAIDVSDVR
ncbi:MAG: hypothetical protein RLY95_369, partial [Pseudomonadota bacterium]